MFIKTIPEKAIGRILMNLCTSTHVHGKQVQKTVRRIGYVDEFTDKYPDPLAHFKEEAKRLTEEEKASKVTLEYSFSEHFDFSTDFNKQECSIPQSVNNVRSYGVLPLMKIYRELELDYFLNIKRQYKKVDYNLNHIFQMLVFGRILSPSSKLATWRDRNTLLNNADFFHALFLS